ncbi:MAG: hypothetical protein ACAH24_09575 [Hyphomicrobiaceae bacterium]|jgi:hypothetical protein
MRDPVKIHRILDVQQQLHRIEEWRLADLDRTLLALAASEQELIRALNEDDALQGLFIDAMARRLASIAEQAARVGEEKTAQEQRLLEHAARKLCAERLAQAVDREVAQAADKRTLLDAIERFIAPAAQASRKIAGP